MKRVFLCDLLKDDQRLQRKAQNQLHFEKYNFMIIYQNNKEKIPDKVYQNNTKE